MLRIYFHIRRPSEDLPVAVNSNHHRSSSLDELYHRAERLGRRGVDCTAVYPDCTTSPLKLFTELAFALWRFTGLSREREHRRRNHFSLVSRLQFYLIFFLSLSFASLIYHACFDDGGFATHTHTQVILRLCVCVESRLVVVVSLSRTLSGFLFNQLLLPRSSPQDRNLPLAREIHSLSLWVGARRGRLK